MGPHLCINLSGRLLQIFRTFVYNFSWELAGRKNFYTQHCIFSQGYLPVKMAFKTVMIRFSALLPISPPFRISAPYECVSLVNKRPYSIIIRVRVRINRGLSSFNCSKTNSNATLQKQWSYVHLSA